MQRHINNSSQDQHWRPLRGDYLLVAAALALVLWLFSHFWQRQAASTLEIRQGDHLFARLTLDQHQQISVPGPLGVSVIEIDYGRVRFIASPCSNQYCVHQGWLKHQLEASLCLPNQVSIRLLGDKPAYDSLNY